MRTVQCGMAVLGNVKAGRRDARRGTRRRRSRGSSGHDGHARAQRQGAAVGPLEERNLGNDSGVVDDLQNMAAR